MKKCDYRYEAVKKNSVKISKKMGKFTPLETN